MAVRRRGGRASRDALWLIGSAVLLGWLAVLLAHDASAPPPVEVLSRSDPMPAPIAATRAAGDGRVPVDAAAPGTPGPGTADCRTSTSLPAIHRWIADLAADDIPRNGLRAMRELRSAGPRAAPLLERALFSSDYQQRQLAGAILRWLDVPPSQQLLTVTVEALRRDADELRRTLEYDAHAAAARFLADHVPRARVLLVQGLGSDDPRQRFLCAFLLAGGGQRVYVAEVCSELIDHLRDNDVSGDALMAAHGLYRLGGAALPYVRAARYGADAQALSLLELIELDLVQPPTTAADLRQRRRLQRVTSVYADPVVQFDLGRSPVPRL